MRKATPDRPPAEGRNSGGWRSATGSTSWATGWGSSPSRCWSSTAPAAPWRPPLLFLGTRFLPALIAPILVARVEQPPPRFALPVIYCGEAAAFGALALLAGDNFSLAGVVVLATIDGALALTGRALTRAVVAALLEPAGELRAGNAVLNVAFTGGAALGPGIAGLVVAGFGVQIRAAARRRLLLRDRLDPAHRRAAAPGRARPRPGPRPRSAPASPTSASRRRCGGCCSPRAPPSSSSPR